MKMQLRRFTAILLAVILLCSATPSPVSADHTVQISSVAVTDIESTEEPSDKVATEPSDEGTTEASTETTTEATTEATEEPSAEATTEATEEPSGEATTEATEEPSVEDTTEATEEPSVEDTTEATEEPSVEDTTEATEEPSVEDTTEATEEPSVEDTTEATEEPSVEDTTEATEESSGEDTIEATEAETVGCEHTSPLYEKDPAVEYVDAGDNANHYVYYTYTPVCVDCGMVFPQYTSEGELQAHESESLPETCDLCHGSMIGSLDPAECDHPTVYVWREYVGEGWIPGESMHSRKYYNHRVCKQCGHDEVDKYPETAYRLHTNDGTGYCAGCGATNVTAIPCSHTDTVSALPLEYQYENFGNALYHYLWAKLALICVKCGAVISDNTYDEEVGRTYEEHTLDANGICTLCGYPESGTGNAPCLHEHYTYELNTAIAPARWQIENDLRHDLHRVQYHYLLICTDCGEPFANVLSESSYEAHVYTDKRCLCGRKVITAPPTLTNRLSMCLRAGSLH